MNLLRLPNPQTDLLEVMIIGFLNYSSHVNREREEAEKRHRAAREAAERAQTEAKYTVSSRDQGMQTEANFQESLG